MEFKTIGIKDKKIFDAYYRKFPQSSSFMAFSTMYLWRRFSNLGYCILPDGNIVMSGFSHHTGREYFSLPETTDTIFLGIVESLKEEYDSIHMPHLTEHQAQLIKNKYGNSAKIINKEENSNYVYETERLESLSGKKLQSKRNHINKFKNKYKYEIVDIDNKDICKKCLEMTDKWFNIKNESDDYLRAELSVCHESLDLYKELDLKGIALVVDGDVIAYSLGEYVMNGAMAHIIIEKAYSDCEGAYSAINNFFIKHSFLDTKYVNREEDMGLEGLRKAKSSYYPAFLIKMYDTLI